MSDKLWSKTEIAYLKRHAESTPIDELADRFHTNASAVREKLAELGLGATEQEPDRTVELLGEGLQLLHEQKWGPAAEKLEAALAESDSKQLSDRIGQYLQICKDRLEKPGDSGDPYLDAVYDKNRGEIDAALERVAAQGADDDERFVYLRASLEALAGRDDDALETLGRAIELEPKNRVHAYHDPDFTSLKGSDAWRELIQPPTAAAAN
ncbi:MAG: hypothetical protein AAGE94_25655 [Acidobacteriota bacterium]